VCVQCRGPESQTEEASNPGADPCRALDDKLHGSVSIMLLSPTAAKRCTEERRWLSVRDELLSFAGAQESQLSHKVL
jgi:hypothetical protein